MAWKVELEESQDLAVDLIERATRDENAPENTLVLHADNGGPMKGSTMVATMQRLGIVPSFSRPRVSDDNAYAQSLFKTLRYPACVPAQAVRVRRDGAHLGRGLRALVQHRAPPQRHRDPGQARHVYGAAKKRTPRRWSGDTRNWNPIGEVALNKSHPDLSKTEEVQH